MTLACGLWSLPAAAVLISEGDGSGNTDGEGFFGWNYVGDVNGQSATYLGNGWVITANHVGTGNFTLDGTVYPWVPGTQVRLRTNASWLADLIVFAVAPAPALDPLPVRTTPPADNAFLIMIGCGRDRGADTAWQSLTGWDWDTTSTKRWGTNTVEDLTSGLVAGTVSFYTAFDEGQIFPEAQAAAGDSGGAVFSLTPEGNELAGIIYVVAPTPGQPSETALFTNLTFVARLDFYLDEINTVMAGGFCGDGFVDGPEVCDDANIAPGDGCDASCQVEPGWECTGEPSACNALAVPVLGAWSQLALAVGLLGAGRSVFRRRAA